MVCKWLNINNSNITALHITLGNNLVRYVNVKHCEEGPTVLFLPFLYWASG